MLIKSVARDRTAVSSMINLGWAAARSNDLNAASVPMDADTAVRE